MKITCTAQCIWDQIPGVTLGCFQEHPALNKRVYLGRKERGELGEGEVFSFQKTSHGIQGIKDVKLDVAVVVLKLLMNI